MAEYNHDTSNLANRLTLEECREVISSIIELDEEYKSMLAELEKDEDESSMRPVDFDESFCGVCISTACMLANGNVYHCPGWQGFVCGNLYESSLIDIWKNSVGLRYLRNLKRGDMKKCTLCDQKDFCSPCIGRFANESKTGNPLEVATHYCEVARVNKEVVMEFKKQEKMIDIKGFGNGTITGDYHIHFGQFHETYYQPAFVIDALSSCGIKQVWGLPTTACLRWDSEEEKDYLLNHIEEKVKEAIWAANRDGIDLRCTPNPES